MEWMNRWRATRWALAGLWLAGALAQATPARAVQVLYDDFDDPSNLVRADLWAVSEFSEGSVTESLRFIDRLIFPFPTADPANGKLFIGRRLLVAPGADAGTDRVTYRAIDATGATGVQVDVTMALCEIVNGRVQARVTHAGFNTGVLAEFPGDRTGDVLGIIQIECTAAGQPVINWLIALCLDAVCETPQVQQTGSIGAAVLNATHTLRVQRVGVSYVFTADGTSETAFPGTIQPANFRTQQIETRIRLNFPAGGGEAAVVGKFDNVILDQ